MTGSTSKIIQTVFLAAINITGMFNASYAKATIRFFLYLAFCIDFTPHILCNTRIIT